MKTRCQVNTPGSKQPLHGLVKCDRVHLPANTGKLRLSHTPTAGHGLLSVSMRLAQQGCPPLDSKYDLEPQSMFLAVSSFAVLDTSFETIQPKVSCFVALDTSFETIRLKASCFTALDTLGQSKPRCTAHALSKAGADGGRIFSMHRAFSLHDSIM